MSCQIVLDNPGSYSPGDSVFGRACCDFTSRQNFRGIRCKFRGREHTAWTERESYYDSSSKSTKYRTVHYSGDNKFIEQNITLIGETSLPPGHYEYPFSFTFPRQNLPNPYNGNYGYIRYYIKAYVDIPFAFDYEDEVTLHLVSPINFNNIVHELQLNPVAYQDEKQICCLCCAGDPITMDLILQKEAFVVGETAKVKVDVTNMSNETITELNLVLKMTIESKTTSPRTSHKYDEEYVAVTSSTGVGAHGQRNYNIDFTIPPNVMIPNFAGCTLFKQWCVLNAEAVIPGCHTNLDVQTGVTLGHIPLMGPATNITYIPAAACPGGAFPPPPPQMDPPPYLPDEKAPPYPTTPPFPSAGNGNSDLKGMPVPMPMPMPMPGGPSSSASAPSSSASAPPQEEGAPSAPNKAKLAEADSFELIEGDDKDELPPPAYQDSMQPTNSKPTAPSAPPK